MDRLGAYRTLLRVVESGSFSAAARELGVGQPAVSKQIAALETSLGTALLTRSTRRLHVTDAGSRLCEAARTILDQVERVESEVRGSDRAVTGQLRVNLPVVFGRVCVVPRLGAFLREHPGVRLDIHFSDRRIDLIEEGVDLLVRIGRTEDSSLIARPLGVTRRALVASPAYLQARGEPRSVDALREHDCLAYAGGRQSGTAWTFGARDGLRVVRLEPRVRADNGQALRDLAVDGHGIALLATWLVAADIEAGRLRVLLPEHEPPPLDIVALYPSRRFLPERARRFIEVLRARLGEHPELRGARRG